MKEIIPIIYFHGSPGVSEEIDGLKRILSNYRFKALPRKGYPGRLPSDLSELEQKVVIMAYSWGCVEALEFVEKNLGRIKGLILISPYLFPDKRTGLKNLVNVPVIGELFLNFIGKKLIKNMMVRTSSPLSVPINYQNLLETLSSPKTIRTAINEKNKDIKITGILGKIAAANIGLGLIYGEEDLVSKVNEQVAPIKRVLKPVLEASLKNAGHAIIFTHEKELADLVKIFIEKI